MIRLPPKAKEHFFLFAVLSAGTALSFAAAPTKSYAAGFYLQEQSVSAMGAAYAGAAALPRDASIAYFNPGAMPALEEGQLAAGANVIFPNADFQDRGSTLLGAPIAGVDSDDPVDTAMIPNFDVAMPFYDGALWGGLTFSSPFGLSSKFDDNWLGRYDSIKADLRTYDVQASLAGQVNDWVSVGAGVSVQYADAELTSAAFDGLEGRSKLSGDDTSWGWDVGILITPMEETKIGINYRSKIDHTLDGDLTVTGTAASNGVTGAKADLNLPDIASVSVAQEVTPQLTLLGQVTWYGWGRFENITVVRDNGTIAKVIEENYDDTANIAVGADYKLNDKITLRAGYQFDPTPVTSPDRTTSTPDGDRHWITAGMSYNMNEKISFDIGLAHIFLSDEPIDLSRNAGLAAVHMDREDSSIDIIGIGFKYKF